MERVELDDKTIYAIVCDLRKNDSSDNIINKYQISWDDLFIIKKRYEELSLVQISELRVKEDKRDFFRYILLHFIFIVLAFVVISAFVTLFHCKEDEVFFSVILWPILFILFVVFVLKSICNVSYKGFAQLLFVYAFFLLWPFLLSSDEISNRSGRWVFNKVFEKEYIGFLGESGYTNNDGEDIDTYTPRIVLETTSYLREKVINEIGENDGGYRKKYFLFWQTAAARGYNPKLIEYARIDYSFYFSVGLLAAIETIIDMLPIILITLIILTILFIFKKPVFFRNLYEFSYDSYSKYKNQRNRYY